jgi:elongation factor Ts
MAKIDLELIKQLRERTSCGMMDCQKALQEAQGDIDKAAELLRKKGAAVAEKRASNITKEGLVHAYIHPGARVGVLLELNCETDFVARTEDMKNFAQDLALHIAAFKPKFVAPADVDQDYLEKEKALFREQLAESKKPASIIDQIVAGKIEKLYSEICLVKQPFVKNDQITIEDVLKDLISKMGENIKIRRFVRYEVGV